MTGNYILKLKDNKWYVGFAADVDKALYQAWNGDGALFVQQHQPLEVIDIIPGKKYTKQLTLMMMREYGIDNVRGHAWSQREFTDKQRANLIKQIQK